MTHPFLTELLAGLNGVTGEPWTADICRDGGWMLFGEPDRKVIASRTDWPHRVAMSKANAAHIAKCSPDRIRAIGEYVEKIERENDTLKSYREYENRTWREAHSAMRDRLAAAEARASALEQKLKALERGVRATSDTAYIASLNKFSSTPCLGWEVKVASGEFGKDEMEAHAEANKLMGKHQGLAEALRLISAALTKETDQ